MNSPAGPLALLRLLQVTDSSFPVGGYAYSHGMEWLVSERRVTCEADLAPVLDNFVAQIVRRQWLPAASMAFRSSSCAAVVRADVALDASLIAEAERDAGRAMGARLLDLAAAAFPAPRAVEVRARVIAGEAPGQFAVAFGVIARDCSVAEHEMLAALGYSMLNSVTQAVVRLGVVGPGAAVRQGARLATVLASAATEVAAARRQRIGSFAPMLELASMLQPTLRFRMFAS